MGRMLRTENLKVLGLLFLMVFSISGCLEESDTLDSLSGGDTSDVEKIEIQSQLPASAGVTIEIGETYNFFVAAVAPFGRIITYKWKWNGATVASGTDENGYDVVGTAPGVGTHTLRVIADDGTDTDFREWTVKINGPPVLTAVTTGTPQVAVGSTINVAANVTDPNGDAITYTWRIDGLPSAFVSSNGADADLTGDASLVGQFNLTVEASDGTASDSLSWVAEVNYFPQPCNELSQGEICTYAGNPEVGQGYDPSSNSINVRIGVMGIAEDALGNLFMADYLNNVVWYWNKTAGAVTRLNVTVPANTMMSVAGDGTDGVGANGTLATGTSLNGPFGLAWDDANATLYVSEYQNHRISRIGADGIIWWGFGYGTNGTGGGTNHTPGSAAQFGACNSPNQIQIYNGDLYMSCYGHHRIKKWEMNGTPTNYGDDTAETIMGDGGTGNPPAAEGAVATYDVRNPYGMYVDADGIYVSQYIHHKLLFYNWSGGAKTFFPSTDNLTVNDGMVRWIAFSGGTGTDDGTAKAPKSLNAYRPTMISKYGNLLLVPALQRHYLYAINLGVATENIGNKSVDPDEGILINKTVGGYNGENVDLNLAEFNSPRYMFVDSSGDLLVADYTNRRVRIIHTGTPTWKVDTLAGTGLSRYGFLGDTLSPVGENLFYYPAGLVYDDTLRNLYVLDRYNNRIRVIDPYGRITGAVGNNTGDPLGENEIPSVVNTRFRNTGYPGMAKFPDGSIGFTDYWMYRVWNRSGAAATYGNVYVDDNRVSTIGGVIGGPLGSGADGVAIGSAVDRVAGIAATGTGASLKIYISDTYNYCVKMIDQTGNVETVVGLENAGDCDDTAGNGSDFPTSPTNLGLNLPWGLAADANGGIYIADYGNHRVRYLNHTGSVQVIAGKVISNGQIATVAGGGVDVSEGVSPATAARINNPVHIAVNATQFCISSISYHNVRCVNISTGEINTVAGAASSASVRFGSPLGGWLEEGVPATSIKMYTPSGITFDANGDLYISDRNNHIIRKVKLSP